MNKNQLLLILGLGTVLAVAALLVIQNQTAPYEQTAREGAKLLPGLDLNAIAAVSLRAGSNAVTLTKQGDRWVVHEREDYPANFSAISDLVRKLWELKIARAVRASPTRLPMLGLAGAGQTPTLVELRDAAGKLLHAITLGSTSQNETRGWPNGRYVMLGTDARSICLVADSLNDVDPAVDRWLNKDFFKVDKVKSVAVNQWTVTRDSESADWQLLNAKPDEKLDTGKVGALSSVLSSPSFNDVVPGTPALDKPVVAKLDTFDGFHYTVKLAKKTDDTYQLQLAVRAGLVKERTPGKDEKPEDKTRLDKEFKDNLKSLEQKLKAEQACANWTYLVSKWTVDQLLKERKDLLVEKKEEPQRSPAPAK